jgi:hypothetical protein
MVYISVARVSHRILRLAPICSGFGLDLGFRVLLIINLLFLPPSSTHGCMNMMHVQVYPDVLVSSRLVGYRCLDGDSTGVGINESKRKYLWKYVDPDS